MKTFLCFLLVLHVLYSMASVQDPDMRNNYCKQLSGMTCSDIEDCFKSDIPTVESLKCLVEKIGNECYISIFKCLRSCLSDQSISSSSIASCTCICLDLS